MKKIHSFLSLSFLLLGAIALPQCAAHAQSAPVVASDVAPPDVAAQAPDVPPPIAPDAVASVVNVVASLVPQKFAGYLVAVASVMGLLRLVFKPGMVIVHAVVAATKTQTDDVYLGKAESSRAFKAMLWGLDYFASIKPPTPKPASV